MSERIALIVVADGIGEIHGIGGVGDEGIVERDGDFPARHIDFRHLLLGR